jgi:lipoyl-dependent peroxiredoxin
MAGKSSSAEAAWTGTGKDGIGALTTASRTLINVGYNAPMRFADASGTNPEEMIAGAHAACFNMALAFALNAAGYTAEDLRTTATVTIVKEDAGWRIDSSALDLTANIPGITESEFIEIAEKAKAGCPVSKVLNAEITLQAKLA